LGLTVLVGSALVPSIAHADAGPRICNATVFSVSVAVGWYGSTSPQYPSTTGWYRLRPGECQALFPDDSWGAHRYYFAYSAYDPAQPTMQRAWSAGPPNGEGLCISHKRFEYRPATGQCQGPDTLRRRFLRIDTVGGRDPDVTLTWENGIYGNFDW